jgi:hypothetical protein
MRAASSGAGDQSAQNDARSEKENVAAPEDRRRVVAPAFLGAACPVI